MMVRRFARPYARAIVDVAGSPEKANAIRGELIRFQNALQSSPELREVYANPGIASEVKDSITQRIGSKLKLSDLALRAVQVVVSNNRIADFEAILDALATYVNEALGVAVAEVRSAKSLTPDEMSQLAAMLGRRVGKKVELDVKTDPSLLGGVVVRIGSEIWDASVVGKIHKFRESLT